MQKVEKSAPPSGSLADLKEKKKERILDLSRYMDKLIRVKFTGGREAAGILKGYDPLLNIVLDNTVEYLRGKVYLLSHVNWRDYNLDTSL